MFFNSTNYLRCHAAKSTRMFTTLIGRSGRTYTKQKVLQDDPEDRNNDICLVKSEGKVFVSKPVAKSVFEISKELQAEFGKTRNLRTHIDESTEGFVLIYEAYIDDLLGFIKSNPPLTLESRKFILREVGEGLKKLHDSNWVHLDVKPNNVMLNWSWPEERTDLQIDRVILTDLDISRKLDGARTLNGTYGNCMWRSPEGLLDEGVGKHSEVFSFGLLCLFTITGAQTMIPHFGHLKEVGVDPGIAVLIALLQYFGPPPEGLLKHVGDESANMLTNLWDAIQEDKEDKGLGPFDLWDETTLPRLDPELKRFLSRMLNLDPTQRPTITEILEDPWWK